MKSFVRTLVTAAFLLTTAVLSSAETGAVQTVLASFDFDIVGVGLKASPEYQAVPKGIASKVNASFEAAGFNLEGLIEQLPNDYTVQAELSGPSFQTPKHLVTKPGMGFDLPTFALNGRHTLANIRLVDGAGNTLYGAVPQVVAIESINDPLVSSVSTRPVTKEELLERGVVFDSSNFSAYDFTVGIATSSGQIPLIVPVIVPTSQTVQQTPTIEASPSVSIPPPSSVEIPPDAPQSAVEIPQNLEVKPFMMEVDEPEKVAKIQLPPIPGVLVIPGNIGFLHQYFSALALVSNGAPQQSGLTIRDVKTVISFPAGEDLTAGSDAAPGDDPLRMAKGENGFFARTMPVMNAGSDGKAGTADDVSSMQPGESGQADFTIEGMKEGTHKVDFDITATLDGLPIGPVTLKGKASGAVLVRNPDFAITLGHPATVRAGEEYDLFITVSNTGKTLANLVSVGLDPRALSGVAFVAGESNSKSIDTILPGSAATVKIRLKSQRTGKVTATAFESPEVRGRFILRAGVGENGIPLSPDSLILPYTGSLSSDLVTSAVGLLGQAWSVATAPAGALPASVLPITKQTVTSRAYDLSEAGLRLLIGDDRLKAVFDLTFDFFGSDVYNKGFDSLRRSSTMGLELNRALGDIFKTGIDVDGIVAFQAALADKVSYRPGHLSIVGGNAPLRLRLTDANGNRTGTLNGNAAGRAISYGDTIAVGENGSSRTNLILVTRLDSPSYTLELAAEDSGSFDLGIVLPDAAGVLTQYVFSGITLQSGANGSMAIQPGTGTMQLILDDDGDGVTDRTLAPTSVIPIPDHAPHIVAATQLTPNFGPGGDKHGRNVAVLFSERVTKESAQNPANYGVDENFVKQAVVQPGSRMAFLLLRDGIGPFFDRTLTVNGVIDQSGKVMPQADALPIRITASGPAAVVTGTVRTARGEPVPGATVRLYQLIWYDDGYSLESRYALFSEKLGNADGSYRFEYVLQNDDPAGPFQIEVINPDTNEVGSLTTGVIFHGQRLSLDIFMKAKGSLSGVVRNESGNPVGGATVLATTLVDGRGQAKVTDASGSFSFSGLMVGAYSLKAVSQATLSEGSTMGTLPDDGTAITQDVTVRRVADVVSGTVVGKVLGADGVTPRSGVIVIINGPNYQNWQRTGADGGFSFTGVSAGTITVKARDDNSGEQSESGGVISTSGQIVTLNVIMKGTGTVTGLVTRDDGKSAAGLYVVVKPSQGQPRVLLTDAAGAFRVDGLPISNVGIDIIDPLDFNRTVASGTVTILSAGDTANIALFVPLKALAVGTVQGTVYHRDGTPWANAPIKRVVNSYQYYNLQADSAGRFTIPNLSLGGYTLTVVAGNEVINVSTDLWFDTQVRTLELRPVGVGSVTGTTWDDADKTMPTGADIVFYSSKPNQVGLLGYDTDNPIVVKSDPQTGRFSFAGVLQGSFTVSSSNIFRPTPVSVNGKIETHGQIVNVDLPLKGSPPKPGDPPPVNQPGSVSGTVLMPDGSAAGKDIRVTLTFGGADVTVTTDEQGHFQFAPIIPSGSYPITAEDPITTLKWKGSAYVPSGLDVPIAIKLLGRGTVTVKVLSATGAAVPNADITLSGTVYPNDSAAGVSDSSGQASFANLSQGSYAVSASGNGSIAGLSGRSQASIPGDKASVTAEVRLAASASVTGRFLKADGVTPIIGGQVVLKLNGQAIAYASSSSDPADAGRFLMQYVPLGNFTVEGYDPVTERRGMGAGRLSADGETVTADVVVTPRGSVKGTVLNYGGSAPVVGAPVSISVSGVANFNLSSVTAPDGTFFYSGVPAGRFTANATDPSNGLRGQASGTLSYENETVTTQVRIAPTGSIAGRVLMPDRITPVINATVRLNGGSPQQVDPVTAGFRYDKLAAGSSYTLASSQPNTRRTGSAAATITHDLEVANGDIILGGVGSVRGVVFDSDGASPLFGAKVELGFSGGTLTDYTAEDGSFSFGDIPTGSFSLIASHTLRTTGASQNGYLQNEGQAASVNLVLGPVASVKATVLLADGVTPSRGGGIRISTSTGRTLTGITDTNGQYIFSNLPAPCTISLYVEDIAGIGIGRAIGVLDHNGQLLDLGTIILDDKPIYVTSVDPAVGSVNVPITQAMRVLFSEPADPATLTSANIYLAQGTGKVAGTLQIDADYRGVVFTPTLQLKGFTLYTMVVSGAVVDKVGRSLALPQSVSFTTVDNIPPAITSVSPVNGTLQVANDAVVRLTFSETVDPNSLDGITLSSSGTPVEVRKDVIQNGTVVALTPLEPLVYNRSYTVNASGVLDMVGNVLSGSLQGTFATLDTIAPTISQLAVPASCDLIKGNSILVSPQIADTDVAFVDFYVDDVRKATVTSAPFTMVLTLDRIGLIHLKAVAQDKTGNRGIATFLDLDVKADAPPQVAITSPADGSTVNAGATLTVTVQAADDLFAKDIILTANGELVVTQTKSNSFGKSFTTSFTFTLPATITQGGTITLTAIAKDSGGNLSVIAAKTITVLDATAPTVTLSSPGQTTLYKPGETGSATVTAADNVGVASISCSTVGATGGSPSFTFAPPLTTANRTFTFVTPVDAVSNAAIQLACTAIDAAGNSTNKSITLQVADVVPPQVTITSPVEGSTVNTGATLTVNVLGTDDLAVKEITLVAAGEVVSTQTKTNSSGKTFNTNFTLAVPPTITQGGSIQLSATVKDMAGNVSQSTLRTITVRDGIAPTITALTSPGQTILYKPGETGSTTVVVSDNMGVTSISCVATGASITSQVLPISPAQTQTTQEFVFQVAANAGPNAAIGITCTAVDAVGNSGSKSLNLTVADVVPPQVSWTLPANNASNLPVNASVTVAFDETLASAAVNGASVALVTADGQAVLGAVTLSSDRKSIAFKPASDLVAGTAYVLTVAATVTDDAGNALVAPYLLNFTADGAAPAVVSVIPAAGSLDVPVGSAVSVVFTERIDPVSVTADLVSLTSISGMVPGSLTVSGDGLSLTFKPYNQLGFSRIYTFTLKAGVRDVSGNATTNDLTATFTTQGPDSDLVGYWPMDGDWTDYSGNGNHGTANGGAAFSSDKVVGTQAGSFDGVNDYVSIPSNSLLTPASAITVEAWVKPNDVATWHQVVTKRYSEGSDPYNSYILATNGAGNANKWSFSVSNGTGGSQVSAVDTDVLVPNVWTHLVGNYDGTNVKLYVNGLLKTVVSKTGAIGYSSLPLRIGTSNTSTGQYFKGSIDEVTIYKRALLPEDILERYNSGLSSDRTPPVVPEVEPVTSPTYSTQIVLRGTKEAGSSIRVNGKQIVAHDANTTWQAVYTLALGQNLLDVYSHDQAGNVSPSVNVVINVNLPLNNSPDTVLNAHMTADNGYYVYLSTNERDTGTQFGSANNWFNTDNFSSKLNSSVVNYLHIYTYDQGGIAGFLGEFTLSDNRFKFSNDTQNLVTNTTDWRAYRDAFGGVSDLVTGLGFNGTSPWGIRPGIASNAQWIWTHDADGDDVAYLSTTIVPVGAAVTATSPGQTAKYKPGETGVATIVAVDSNGITKLYCNASGAASEGTLVVPFDPPQTNVTQQFNFQVSPDAAPYAPYNISCIAESINGVLGTVKLDLQAADIVPAIVASTSVTNNATGVIATLPITVTFNETMSAASITSDTVQLRRVDNGAVVAGTSALSADGKTLTFSTAVALECSTSYQFVIQGVSDLGGNSSDYSLNFTTQPLADLLIENKGAVAAPFSVASGRYGNVTIKNSYVVFAGPVAANAVSLASNSTLSHNATGVTGAQQLELEAVSVSIDSTSKIDVSSKGYLGGLQGGNSVETGRTYGNTTTGGSAARNGASYGGTGGTFSSGTANAAYGSIQSPNEVGSGGGGYAYYGYAGGNGGGLVKVTAGTLSLYGSILADGGNTTSFNGGGSGGGILLAVGTLSGNGTIYVRGGSATYGTAYGSGSGGRIAIYYDSMTLPTFNVLASGGKSGDGSNAASNGGAGTIYLKDNTKTKPDVIINNGGITTSNATSIPGGDYGSVTVKSGSVVSATGSYTIESDMVVTDTQLSVSGNFNLPANLTITNSSINVSGTVTVPGNLTMNKGSLTLKDTLQVTGNIVLTNQSVLSHYGASTTAQWKLDITAPSIIIDSTSKIDVTGKGYLGSWQNGNGGLPRRNGNVTYGTTSDVYNGGSYGGLGGIYTGNVNGSYGDMTDPNDLGSGGSGHPNYTGNYGGNGGGLIRLKTGMLTLNGSIVADGVGGSANNGAGSGGGIRLDVGSLTGSGTIYARGGASNSSSYGSGGGGRIAVYYDTNVLPTANILASGGKSGDGSNSARNGGAGTIYLKDNAKTKPELVINNGGIATSRSTSVPGGDYISVTVKGGAIIAMGGSFTTETAMVLSDTTLSINGGYTAPGDLVLTNSTLTVTTALNLPANLALTNSTLNVSGGVTVPGNLSMNKGNLTLKDILQVAGNINLTNLSVLSHYGASTTAQWKLDITAPSITIDSTSKIDVTGKGYLGSWQNGNGGLPRRNGNVTYGTTSDYYNGGSYGGLGGIYNGNVNSSYGDMTDPNDLGTGGSGNSGSSGSYGGNGGGFVRLKTGTLALNGSIIADGVGGSANYGAGSGGGIRLDVGSLTGSGTIYARGGYSSIYGSGGGGRIAIYYDSMTLPTANIIASGGKTYDGSYSARNGGAGTICLKNNANIKADLIINNGGITTTRSTPIPGGDYRIYDVIGGAVVSASGPITSENEILIKDTQVTISGDYTVPRNLTLTNSTVTVSGTVTVPGNLLMTNSTMSVRNNLNVTGTITAQAGSVLTHEGATTSTQYGLDIKAAGITIDSTSRIDVKGKGYLGGLQGDNGSDVGRTAGNTADGGSAAGNGGGLGGVGGNIAGVTATSYGSLINPAELGSGGGGDLVTTVSGGNGGGFVKLTAPTLTLNGTINSDGMDSAAGAGSGGSIRLDITTISGSGSITARGGNGGLTGAGGGRIALYYTSNSIPTGNINASGSAGGDGSAINRNGGAGTVYLKQSAKAYADLVINNRGLDSVAASTPLKSAGKGTITVISGSSLIQSNSIWPVSALIGYWLNPNINQPVFFKILDNSADTIFINPADGYLNSLAVPGETFSGVFALNSLTVSGKAHLSTDEQFNVVGDASIDDAIVVAGELIAGRTLLTNGGLFEKR